MRALSLLIALAPFMSSAANYTAERVQREGIEVVRLFDAGKKTEVIIVPSFGNNSVEMTVKGKNIFWSPAASLGELYKKPVFAANPFLAPWANRLDHDGFYANGKHYAIDPNLKNYRTDPHKQPIHGLIAYAKEWKVVDIKADSKTAQVTSRLEFFRYPDYMAQFPFAHTIEMTYRLQDGVLEVETSVENQAAEPMPVSIGYHPYFKIHDAPRDQWKVQLAARDHLILSSTLVPTGENKPVQLKNPVSLSGTQLDDVFSGLIRGENGRSEFSVTGIKEKISVVYGPKYPVAVVYAPAGRDFICFEPMSGPTNAFNLHHAGKYKDLQTIPVGGKWRESFWIQTSGF
jgi:aldose 1-epimerase